METIIFRFHVKFRGCTFGLKKFSFINHQGVAQKGLFSMACEPEQGKSRTHAKPQDSHENTLEIIHPFSPEILDLGVCMIETPKKVTSSCFHKNQNQVQHQPQHIKVNSYPSLVPVLRFRRIPSPVSEISSRPPNTW